MWDSCMHPKYFASLDLGMKARRFTTCFEILYLLNPLMNHAHAGQNHMPDSIQQGQESSFMYWTPFDFFLRKLC